ncbi:hydroxyacylglutathione hydrolase [Pelagibacterium halotolerans]|uniref:hydroxyacylglutathione hydrolase n=1 Tax=Pelagibacterium halotolerans TaxID=531813 RepID=UPI00384ACA8D
MPAQIAVFTARSDNFGYLVHDRETGRTAAIDAPEEKAILDALAAHGWTLSDILVTHHHGDHTEAIGPLKARFGARVVGPRGEADKIEGLDELVSGGDRISVGALSFEVIDVPGHTLGHIAYHAPEEKALFSGDALFSLGVGRMFEGTPEPMWAGLKRLKALDPQTAVYCGHEYTLANAKFALSVDPSNESLIARAEEAKGQIESGLPTIPARLGDEIAANPFLRADTEALAGRMGLQGADPVEVFGALRRAKDQF